jgi:hypothetical protein
MASDRLAVLKMFYRQESNDRNKAQEIFRVRRNDGTLGSPTLPQRQE